MKKGFVVLLVVLALIVLISPGIIGRIAEKSVDENLQWVAEEHEDVVVSSERFDRGWFSSESRHRVEIRDPGATEILFGLVDIDDPDGYPALIVDTHLDHGLIPAASIARDKGTLTPGLGSAVSTVHIVYPNGETFPLPGTIYSRIGLTGQTDSTYIAEPGSQKAFGSTATWGAVDVTVTSNPSTRDVVVDGLVDSFTIAGDGDTLAVGRTTFAVDQIPSKFGISVGDMEMNIESVAVEESGADMLAFGPLSFDGASTVDGDRLNGGANLNLGGVPVPGYGEMGLSIAMRFTGLDGAATARVVRTLGGIDETALAEQLLPLVQNDLQALVAAGFEIQFDRFDFELPQGPVTSTMRFTVDASDASDFDWTSILLNLDAEAEFKIAAEFVESAMVMNPQAATVVAMGYLRKRGDIYEMRAEYAKGLLTVNGAPMPIPLSR